MGHFFLFFVSLAVCFPPFESYDLKVSMSGLYSKKNNFSAKPVLGFHKCSSKLNLSNSIRDKRVLLSFPERNDTVYIRRHCNQLLLNKDIETLSKIVPNGYYFFYVNNKIEKVQAGKTNHIYTDYLLTISEDNFKVTPIKSVELDKSSHAIVLNISFYVKISTDFNNRHYKKNHQNYTPYKIPLFVLLLFLPSVALCFIWSKRVTNLPQLSNFYRLSLFITNTLLFTTNGLIQITQILLYFFFNHSKPFSFTLFSNLLFPSIIIPTFLRIFIGQIFNLISNEADFISCTLGTVFSTYLPIICLSYFNTFFFGSFSFGQPFIDSFKFTIYLIVMFICARGVGYYFTSLIIPHSYGLSFEGQRGIIEIDMPKYLNLFAYGFFSSLLVAQSCDHLVVVVMKPLENPLDVNYIFAFYFAYLAFTAFWSTLRTHKRINSMKDSWQEDHIIYSFIGSFLASVFILIDSIFLRGVSSLEMALHVGALCFCTFAFLFVSGTATSFLFAFGQCYYAIIKPHMK